MPEGGIVTRLVKGRLEVSNGIVCGDNKADILPYSLWSVSAGVVR